MKVCDFVEKKRCIFPIKTTPLTFIHAFLSYSQKNKCDEFFSAPPCIFRFSFRFHCSLCDYKSCIQAKVKRHLRNVHKCPTDQMTYNPRPDIRVQVTEMKLRCFPRMAEAADLAMVGKSTINNNDFSFHIDGLEEDALDSDGDDDTDDVKKSKADRLLDTVLNDKHSLTDDASAFINIKVDDEELQNETTTNGEFKKI